jgi:hypothetical protein
MHKLIIDEKYEFIPPHRGKFWSWAFRTFLLRSFLRRNYGITGWTMEGLDHLRSSMKSGHGILLCPNHCRPSDPMMMGVIVKETPCHVYAMASWHIFKQSWLESFIVRRIGGFSVYREGLDRQALETSVDIVASAERPLVIFPEGVISRSNDRLLPLMEGVSFVARTAAKKRAKLPSPGKVVIHPVAIRYQLQGTPEDSVGAVLTALEGRTFWQAHDHLPIRERISQLGKALMASREIEYFGSPQLGRVSERKQRLIRGVLEPIERLLFGAERPGDVISRVKEIRSTIVPKLLDPALPDAERKTCWRQLTDVYYIQCLSLYPPHYLDDNMYGVVTPERIVETVHRLEEDLTDKVTIKPEWHAHFKIGEPIEVDPAGRRVKGVDPLMQTLRQNMLQLLGVDDWWPDQYES